MPIRLTQAAEYYKGLPHQCAAFNWLEGELSSEQLEEFATIYRAATEVKHSNEPGTQLIKEYSNNWDGVLAAASQAGARYPECVAAQWALESSWGAHTSGANNFFGLKGDGADCETKEFINGEWVTITAGFIDFPSLYSCVDYLVTRWYKDYKGYKGVNRANSRNECAELLVKEGYATDPDYAQKLQQIMDRQSDTLGTTGERCGLNPNSDFSYKVTPHITYGELCLNEEARRFKNMDQCHVATEICEFLETVRTKFGNKPIVITSGHRPEPINSQVGGAANSEHTYNCADKGAVDFYISGADLEAVQNYVDKHWPYSVGYGAAKGFVHIGIRPGRERIRWDY